jgi:hypothetical protein
MHQVRYPQILFTIEIYVLIHRFSPSIKWTDNNSKQNWSALHVQRWSRGGNCSQKILSLPCYEPWARGCGYSVSLSLVSLISPSWTSTEQQQAQIDGSGGEHPRLMSGSEDPCGQRVVVGSWQPPPICGHGGLLLWQLLVQPQFWEDWPPRRPSPLAAWALRRPSPSGLEVRVGLLRQQLKVRAVGAPGPSCSAPPTASWRGLRGKGRGREGARRVSSSAEEWRRGRPDLRAGELLRWGVVAQPPSLSLLHLHRPLQLVILPRLRSLLLLLWIWRGNLECTRDPGASSPPKDEAVQHPLIRLGEWDVPVVSRDGATPVVASPSRDFFGKKPSYQRVVHARTWLTARPRTRILLSLLSPVITQNLI